MLILSLHDVPSKWRAALLAHVPPHLPGPAARRSSGARGSAAANVLTGGSLDGVPCQGSPLGRVHQQRAVVQHQRLVRVGAWGQPNRTDSRQQPLLRASAKHTLRNPPWLLIQCTPALGAAPLCSRTCGEAFQRGGHAGGVGGRPICLCLVHNQGQLGVQRLRREGKGRGGGGGVE